MSDPGTLQLRYDDLITHFVQPLVTGGTVRVDLPHAPGAIGYYQYANSSDGDANHVIFDALHRAAGGIARVETVPWPDRDLLLICMAAVNLIYATDPVLDRVFARSARARVLAWVDELVDAIAPPNTRADALCRHALLDPFTSLRRKDIVGRKLGSTYRFVGRATTTSLFTRPVFGRAAEQQTLTDLASLLLALDLRSGCRSERSLRALLSRSPITELVRLDLCKPFRFGLAAVAVLSDDSIRGGIAREIVARGEWKAAPQLGRALAEHTLLDAPAGHLYYALALCFEAQMTATLDVPGPGLPEKLDLSDPDTARYAAVLPAFFDDDSMLDEVRAFGDVDRVVIQQRCGLLSEALPDGIKEQIAPLVRRCRRPGRDTQATITTEVHP